MCNEQRKVISSDVSLERLVSRLNYFFCVPNYQRHFVWTEKEVQLFLKDGEYCWKKYAEDGILFEHFAGQLILRKTGEDRNKNSRMEIVDGQQRLTTFMLLVSMAGRIMKSLGCTEEAEQIEKLYFKNEDSKRRLTLSRPDQDFWERLTNANEDIDSCVAERESHKCLKKAGKSIYDYLLQLVKDEEKEQGCKTLCAYVDAVAKSFQFVLLETRQPGYMYALYQIVNDRGLPLTSGELLKARIMELLADKKELSERAEDWWDDILQDAGKTTDKYLSWNFVAVLGKRMETKGTASIHEQYEKEIFDCYNKRIISESGQASAVVQVEQLGINVTRLRNLEHGALPCDGISENTKVIFEALITWLKNTFCIPLYLKILEMNEKQICKTIENITPMLAKAFFVAKTMGGLHDEVIARYYLEIWGYIERYSADMDKIRECLRRLMKEDGVNKIFIRKLQEDLYIKGTGNGKAKFLLLMLELENYRGTGTGKRGCSDDSIAIKLRDVSIEHILKDSVDERAVSKKFYNSREKIGNLTLIGKGLNGILRDKDFEEKRGIYQKSPYCITRAVGELEQWKGADFEERQKRLTEELPRIFEL